MADDFHQDLGRFAERGEIGPLLAIAISPAEPEIGQHIAIVCHGIAEGVLRSDAGGRWCVGEGTRVDCIVLGTIRFELVDLAGRSLAETTCQPHVAVPALGSLNLASRLTYAEDRLRLAPEFSQTAAVDGFWRSAGSADWQPLPPLPCEMPLAAEPATLDIRLVMRSRHAGLHPAATVEVVQRIYIHHPEPAWRIEGPLAAERFVPAQLHLAVRWCLRARLHLAGHAVACEVASPRAVARSAGLSIPTHQAGPQVVAIEIDALDGSTRHATCVFSVNPREAGFRCSLTIDGEVAYALFNAEPVALQVPATGQYLPLAHARGVIELPAMPPTLVLLYFQDDAGKIRAEPMSISLPPPAWPTSLRFECTEAFR